MKDRQELDYSADLRIDPEGLDVEWLEQPGLFMRYAEACADAAMELDRAKAALDVVRAETEHKVRSHPARYHLEKITESAVQGAVTLSGPVQEATGALSHRRREHDLLKAAVRAMDCRKTALEELVRLAGQSYFAGPNVPRNLPEEAARMREAHSARATDRVKGATEQRRRRRS